ncbi:MAG: hypothetical protein U0271_34330 [Polyangiaceae bacterium]
MSGSARGADRIREVQGQFPACNRSQLTPEKQQARVEAAKRTHQAALQAYENRDWQAAARLWTEAYAFDCSRPRVFMNIGDSYERAGDAHAALAMYLLLKERVDADQLPGGIDEKIEELRAIVQEEDAAHSQ